MKTLALEHWKFSLAPHTGPWAPAFDDQDWEDVITPHDWAVSFPFSRSNSSGTGYLPGGTGWYRARFPLARSAEGALPGTALISFDGVYKNSQVWCNGYYLGMRPSGYSSFSYDISHAIREGDNVVTVKVSHEDIADSRWYTGSGIYRAVTLEFHDRAFIPSNSIVVTTEVPEGRALIRVSADLQSASAVKDGELTLSLAEPETGRVFTTAVPLGESGPGARPGFEAALEVPRPRLWSPDAPALYTLELEGQARHGDGGVSQIAAAPLGIGIRTIVFDPDRGFFINGKAQKLKGVCVHHDAGCLGAAVRPEVWRRRLEKLREAGCNALRMSHNPHMSGLYDLCDEMGFLVMDEAFDEWEGCKNKWFHGHNVYPPVHQGYYEHFPQWHGRDLADMVIRGRNHPSVILWSIGNEIDYPNDPYVHPLFEEMTGNNDAHKPQAERVYDPQKPNMERLAALAAKLAGIVKEHDPTRPVIAAAAFPELSSRLGFLDALDVAGYNYKEALYEGDHRRFPKLPLLGSENGHHLAAWEAARDTEYVSGQFLWTGVDYLGEARGWPVRGSGAGLLDLAGFEKIPWFRRKCLWRDEPLLYLAACLGGAGAESRDPLPWELFRAWNFPKGSPVRVICYGNVRGAELFLNGESLGVQRRDSSREYFAWTLPFERGRLEVRDPDGRAADALESTLPGVSLRTRLWEPAGGATAAGKGADAPGAYRLGQIEADVIDEEGRFCGGESPLVEVSLDGPGKLAGMENGDLADCSEYAAPRRRMYRGRLIVYILRPRESAEKTILTLAAEGLASATLAL